MNNRTRKQHFVSRFYLESFADAQGLLWTHDSKQRQLRQTNPENTGFESNIYSPIDENGDRFDGIEELLSKIESLAAPTLNDLKAFRKLDSEAKANFASFIACTFVRSPAQIENFATNYVEMTHWATSIKLEMENKRKSKAGILTMKDAEMENYLLDKSKYEINVQKKVGSVSFRLLESFASLIYEMNWTFEVSENQELITRV